MSGLGESVTKKWSGDVDLNDGKLTEQYKKYEERLKFVDSLGLKHSERRKLVADLMKTNDQLNCDLTFASKGINTVFHITALIIYFLIN